MLFLATVVRPVGFDFSIKDDAVAICLPPDFLIEPRMSDWARKRLSRSEQSQYSFDTRGWNGA